MENLVSTILNQLAMIALEEVNLVRGVDAELEKLTDNLQAIQAVLEDAERRQVMEATVKLWVEKLKDISYDIDDVLDEWNTALLKLQNSEDVKKVCSLPTHPSGFCFCQVGLRHVIAVKIKELNARLVDIVNQKNAYNFASGTGTGRGNQETSRLLTTSIIDVPKVFGREKDTDNIRNMLLSGSSTEGATLRIISIVGMGGLGKTTLARLAFNDAGVESHFDKKIWVCVSDPFDDSRISKEILESLGTGNTDLVGMGAILEEIGKGISGKKIKILLVLDDVWTEDSTRWEPLRNSLLKIASPGSKILITTRKEKVAMVMGSRTTDMYHVGILSLEKCWDLFTHLAFSERTGEDRKKLEGLGGEIVKKCKGLPLVVKTVASLLRFKKSEQQWQNVLESELWNIEKVEEDVFPALFLSYYDLPSILKHCFSYCAIFPQDHVIKKGELIMLWMAQGFLNKTTQHNMMDVVVGSKKGKETKDMEMVGEEYFHELATRSFFQDFEKDENGEIVKCKMHDMVHSFARFLMRKECCLVKVDGLEKPWKANLPSKTIRHLALMMEAEVTFPIPRYNWEKVRSLLIQSDGSNSRRENNLLNSIDKLTCLRTLHLNLGADLQKGMLSRKIGKLIHLRYLNLSYNNVLKTLPEAICDLYNLQIFDLSGCSKLRRLPQGLGKLHNLKYLENKETGKLEFIPKGLKRLTNLRILRKLRVDTNKNSFKLGDLGNLANLQGSLMIRGLYNVKKASEAREARLSTKIGLRHLDLVFDSLNESGGENEAAVVEALQPPPSLQRLEIWYSNGPTLTPSWITYLTMVKTIVLSDCFNWKTLPPLGKLASLESLCIQNMKKVEKVGQEFLGMDTSQEEEDGATTAFPNLTKLAVDNMAVLEDWEYVNPSSKSSGTGVIIMPRLHSLTIKRCPNLKALPHHLFQHQLRELSIEGCPILSQRFEERKGVDWPYISRIPKCSIEPTPETLSLTVPSSC
ncbi:Disease resistance protein [Corchorus capsularis]|uniref:Disease resistance protein n=1 Tax=Corchorus capsularis TaxID=210143 RepID=A0A1R3HKS3_COCAP|nr:Disease resistance protein [Corchorus capsularis]